MVGSTKDPADGKAVAGSIFAAVVVYAVRLSENQAHIYQRPYRASADDYAIPLGLPSLLRFSSISTRAAE